MDLIFGTESGGMASLRPKSGAGASPGVEGELEAARRRIEALEASLDAQTRASAELLQLVSHELRTPITVIRGFGRLLQDEAQGRLNADQRHYVAEALKACRRLDRFVEDLLAACPDSGVALAIEASPTDLHATIESQLAAFEPILLERAVVVERALDAVQPRLCFDPDRIEQVITNLLTNALRYGRPGGRLRISTRSIPEPACGSVMIAVEDDGPGIAPCDRERVFEPYFRVQDRSWVAGERTGLGIGLAICRRIAEAHGGSIRAEASELGGARIEMRLPGPVCPDEES